MSQVGEATISLRFDTKELAAGMKTADKEVSNFTKTSESKLNAWSVATGALIAKGFTKVASTISNQLSDAVYRADVLNRFPKVMTMMGYSAEDASKAIGKLRDGVAGIPTSLADVVSATQRIAAMTGDVNKAADWSLAISDAMIITTGSAEDASRATEQFLQVLSRGKPQGQDWNTIMEVAAPIMNELAKSMGYTSAALGGDLYTALQKGEVSVEQLMEAMVQLDKEGGNGLESLHDRVKTSTGGIAAAVTNLRQRISNALVDVIEQIGHENIESFIKGIADALVGLTKVIGGLVSFIAQNQWIIAALAGAIAPLMAFGIAQKLIALKIAIAAVNPPLLAVIAACGVLAAAATWIQDNWSGISEFFGNIWQGFMMGAEQAWNTITSLFSGLASFFGSIFTAAWTQVKNVFSTGGQIFMGIVDGILSAFKAIVNTIIKGINSVVAIPFNGINGFLSFLKSVEIVGLHPFGWVNTVPVPQIPYLATGGIVPDTKGGRMIVAGEGGEDEWVVPESKMASLISQINAGLDQQTETAGAGRSITVNMYNNIASGLDADEIGQRMLTSIRRTTL